MNFRGRRFEVDKANGKIAGVCAGLGETLSVDPNVVRIGFVLAAIIGHAFFAMLILYAVLAVIGGASGRDRRRAPAQVETKSRRDEALDERLRAHERRMKEIDTFVAGSNSRLAREIEELRQD
jgi:phage shock protein PspC (stress-responsive transcriptional regulator)